jgi:ribosomal protein S18 acetylase RimI-like enzyme
MGPTYRVIESIDDNRVHQLMELYRHEWWTSRRTVEQTRAILHGSDLAIGICDETEDRLVAFARVLTDGIARAFIFDVIVAAGCRGRGLGRRVVDEVLSHPAVKDVELVELYCRPELVPFYERLGFSSPDSGVVLMRRRH